MKSYGKDIPYVKFTAKIKKFPIGEIGGIISVVKDEKGNDKILVSANEKKQIFSTNIQRIFQRDKIKKFLIKTLTISFYHVELLM